MKNALSQENQWEKSSSKRVNRAVPRLVKSRWESPFSEEHYTPRQHPQLGIELPEYSVTGNPQRIFFIFNNFLRPRCFFVKVETLVLQHGIPILASVVAGAGFGTFDGCVLPSFWVHTGNIVCLEHGPSIHRGRRVPWHLCAGSGDDTWSTFGSGKFDFAKVWPLK